MSATQIDTVKQSRAAVIPTRVKVIAWIVGVIVLLVIIIFSIVKIRTIITERKERKKVNYVEGGGALRPGFNPGTYADKMFNVMDGIFTLAATKGEAAQELMQLNDNELIAVHNYWNEHLYDRNGETLYKMMKNEINVPEITFGENIWQSLLNRLSRLNLISK